MSFSDEYPEYQLADWRMSGFMRKERLGAANGKLNMHVIHTRNLPNYEDLQREERLRYWQEREPTPPPQLDQETIDKFRLVGPLESLSPA